MAGDHDLLIQLNAKVNNLCNMLHEQKENHKEIMSKFDKRTDECNICKGEIYTEINKKVGFSLFKYLMGGLASLFLLAFIYFATNMHFLDKQLAVLKTQNSFASNIEEVSPNE